MMVNLFGYFLVTKHACRVMKKQRSGSIININSKSGKRGSAANSAYTASKFGGIGHTQSVALEMARHGVRCNAICPGNLLEFAPLDRSRKRVVRSIPPRGEGPRRARRRRCSQGLHRPGADETGLQLRRCLQRGGVPRFGCLLIHHGRRAQRHRRPGNELTARENSCADGDLLGGAASQGRRRSACKTGTLCEGPRTDEVAFTGLTWLVTSQSNKCRIAVRSCFTVGTDRSRPSCSM